MYLGHLTNPMKIGKPSMFIYPNFSQNTSNFPNARGPGPIPKNGSESPECI